MPDNLRDFAERYTNAWNSGEPEQVASYYGPVAALTINGGEANTGHQAIRAVAESFMAGYPDMQITFDGLEERDGRILYHWTFEGHNSGPGGTGNLVRISGHESWLMDEDGLIADSLGSYDAEDWERQVGGD
jgi:nuclear transport factor 2 (NTF2) superfamily protein